MTGTAISDRIDIATIHAEMDEINTQVLVLLERGKALTEDAAAALTADAFAAGVLVCLQSSTPDVANPAGGIVTSGTTAGYVPITSEQYDALIARLTMVGKMVRLLDQPLTNGATSFAQQIRALGRRWRVRA